MRIQYILTLILAVYCPLIFAQKSESLAERLAHQTLSAEDWTSIFVLAEDNPKSFLNELARLWQVNSSSEQSLLKVRTAWMIGRFANYEDIDDPSVKVVDILREAIGLAQKHKLNVSVDELTYFLAYIDDDRVAMEDQGSALLLNLAARIKDPPTRAFALNQLLFDFVNQGKNAQEIPRLLQEVTHIVPMNQSPTSPVFVDSLNTLAVVFGKIGQKNQVEKIDRILNEVCQKNELRGFCAVRAYNQGILSLNDKDSIDSGKAKELFQRAHDLAQQVTDKTMEAKSLYGLGRVYRKEENFPKAAEFSRRATEYFLQYETMDWAASAFIDLSKAYLGMGEKQRSLAAALKAQSICPPLIDAIMVEIYQQLSLVHDSLGNSDQALQDLRKYVEIEKKIRTDDTQKKYMLLRDESLTRQNDLQAAQILLLKKFRIVSILAVCLALILLVALFVSVRQFSIIRASRKQMKVIMDHIEEGIVLIDRQLKIQKGYSQHFDKLFSRQSNELVDVDFLNLFSDQDKAWRQDIVVAREALRACMGESELCWDFNKDKLPQQAYYHGKILAFHWQPLFNAHDLVTQYLVSIRDVTAFKQLEREMQHQTQKVDSLQGKLMEVLGGNIASLRNFVAAIKREVPDISEAILRSPVQQETLRTVHTWKGVARSLGVKQLALSIHELESSLMALEGSESIDSKWQDCSLCIQDYDAVLQLLVVSNGADDARATGLYHYTEIYAQEIKNRLESAGCLVEGLIVQDNVLDWTSFNLSKINQILLHVMTNALDHGFIRPSQKQQKVNAALVKVEARKVSQHIEILVSDNGVGIDWQAVSERAKLKGMAMAEGHEPSDFLFIDGLSTADQVSETSGRGVGLSAVRSLCRELSGDVTIHDNPSGGTLVKIELPSFGSDH